MGAYMAKRKLRAWTKKDFAELKAHSKSRTPVSAGDVVFAAATDSAPVIAIRADGSGDVTASRVLWKGEDNTPDICSPLATDEFVFLLTTEGMLTSYDARKGDKLWE